MLVLNYVSVSYSLDCFFLENESGGLNERKQKKTIFLNKGGVNRASVSLLFSPIILPHCATS